MVNEDGDVSVPDRKGRQRQGVAVHIGFDKDRAKVWIMDHARDRIVEFDVKKEFLDKIRNIAKPEQLGPGETRDRTKPWKVDVTKAPDQYAIPPSMFEELELAIESGSGKITRYRE